MTRGPRIPAPPAADWADAEPDAICARLGDPGLSLLTTDDARAVWERASALRLASPAVSHRLAASLLAAVDSLAGPGDHAIRAIAWCCHAETSNAVGRLQDAIRDYRQAAVHGERAEDAPLLGRILLGLVHVLALAGQAEESAAHASRAETLLRRARLPTLLGKLYMNRGNALYQQDRYREALDAYGEADRAFAGAGVEDQARVGLWMNQAIACTNLEDHERAGRLFHRAEALADALRLDFLGAYARFNRAILERLRGDFRSALRLLETAGDTFAKQEARDMVAAARRARAQIYLELGMPVDALELARSAAADFAAERMELDAAISRQHEAQCLVLLGRAGEAVPLVEEARRTFRALDNPVRLAMGGLDLAECQLELACPKAASALARESLRQFERRGLAHLAVRARCLVARGQHAGGRSAAARRTLLPATSAPAGLPLASAQELWAIAGRIALESGDHAAARTGLERAAALLETQRLSVPGVEFRASLFERKVEVYHDLVRLELASRAPRPARLLKLVERARARGYRERLRGAGRRKGKASTALQRRRMLLGALTRRLEEAEFAPGAGPASAGAPAVRRRVVALEHEILRMARAQQEREGSAETGGTPGAEARALAGALRTGEALVEYFVSEERVIALVLRPQGLVLRVLPVHAAAAGDQVERLAFLMDAVSLAAGRVPASLEFQRRAADAALAELYRSLFLPLEDLLSPARRLLLVPHAFLHQVPFPCLHDGVRYAQERWTIGRLPTADFLLRRRSRRRAAKNGPAAVELFGTVSAGPAQVEAELAAVAAAFPPDRARVTRDPGTSFLLSRLPHCRIAHLVSHATFRGDNPAFSRITTGDGALFLSDILETRLRAELVVLSACNTGRVFSGRGDDLQGVAHAFLAAGARSLVASLWRVHDDATAALMGDFYRHLTRGKGPLDAAEALRLAEADTRARWDHPFYWGAFAAHGG